MYVCTDYILFSGVERGREGFSGILRRGKEGKEDCWVRVGVLLVGIFAVVWGAVMRGGNCREMDGVRWVSGLGGLENKRRGIVTRREHEIRRLQEAGG